MYGQKWSIRKDVRNRLPNNVNDLDVYSMIYESLNIENDKTFFNPTIEDLYDPFLLPDMGKACDRILEAVDNAEKIGIFGDYDVDGVCATACLFDFLKKSMEADVSCYLPSRFDGGYGLTNDVIDSLALDGINLLITVDNGISCKNEIEYAYSKGIDVIVTDHHGIPAEIPTCCAIVEPWLPDSSYPNQNLCGCAVAYKLCEALSISVGMDEQSIYLPLVALATIADVMKLVGENRSIVILGLKEITESAFPGLNLLVKNAFEGKPLDQITAGDISFYVTPKLNSAGRVGNAKVALDLILSETEKEARIHLAKIEELNNIRRETTEAEFNELTENSSLIISKAESPVVIVKANNWNQGINGVIAPRIVSKTGKSCVVLVRDTDNENEEDPMYVGSARSVDGVNLLEAILKSKDILEKYGGHSKACGISIRESKIPDFVINTENAIAEQILNNCSKGETSVFYLPFDKISIDTIKRIKKLEPFGEGAEVPVFLTDGIESLEVQAVGTNKNTTKFTFGFPGGVYVNGINFNDSKHFMHNKIAVPYAVVYTLSLNYFGGRVFPQMNVIDIIEGDISNRNSIHSYSLEERVENCEKSLFESYHLSKNELSVIYLLLKSLENEIDFDKIMNLKIKLRKTNDPRKFIFTWFKVEKAIEIFVELGLLLRIENGKYEINCVSEKKDMNTSKLYNELKKD